MLNMVNWPPSYYIIRDRLPLYMLLLYLLPKRHRSLADQLTIPPITVIAGFTLYFTYNRLTGTPWSSILSFWNYPAPITWGTFIVATYLRQQRHGGTDAANLAILAASTGGWLHEIPWFTMQGGILNTIRINSHNTFMISFQILALPILALILSRHEHRWTTAAIAATILYLLYIPSFIIDPIRALYQNQFYGNWLTRLPTVAMLTAHLEATK